MYVIMLKISLLITTAIASQTTCIDEVGNSGPCAPGTEYCGAPFINAPFYHLMDQHGCGENDPNGPSFDPVHGVIHHFYQIHLAAKPGHGPDYGHFVSKDFVHWTSLPVAIWNGLDKGYASNDPKYITKYDNEAIFTGSGIVVDGAAPDGKGPGLIQIYPGLCNKNDWPTCETGTLLAQAIPHDYANDELLTNWTKPSYNPIIESTQRDPSTPWQMPSGEWRLRTYDSKVYGTASSNDMILGKWYEIGINKDFRQCECPSLYPLPKATPGTEERYDLLKMDGTLPTHVHKTSCGGDWWQMGTYTFGAPKVLGNFTATLDWEDLFVQRSIDKGAFYASKDNIYPTKQGTTRRINWGWATIKPASAQTLPREITFNPDARSLQQYPIQELKDLRKNLVYSKKNVTVSKSESLGISSDVIMTSEIIATFELSTTAATFGLALGISPVPIPIPTNVSTFMEKTDLPGGDYNITHMPPNTDPKECEMKCNADTKCQSWTYVVRGTPMGSGDCCLKTKVPCPKTDSSTCTSGSKTIQSLPNCPSAVGSSVSCIVEWNGGNSSAPFVDVPISCGTVKDTLRILSSETTVEIRMFADVTFQEVYFQQGRTAMTINNIMSTKYDYILLGNDGMKVQQVDVWPIGSPWISEEEMRKQPRIYKN